MDPPISRAWSPSRSTTWRTTPASRISGAFSRSENRLVFAIELACWCRQKYRICAKQAPMPCIGISYNYAMCLVDWNGRDHGTSSPRSLPLVVLPTRCFICFFFCFFCVVERLRSQPLAFVNLIALSILFMPYPHARDTDGLIECMLVSEVATRHSFSSIHLCVCPVVLCSDVTCPALTSRLTVLT